MTETISDAITLKRSLALYRPLLVAGLLVVTLAVIWLYTFGGGHPTAHRAMNTVMGCFFLIFALPKFVNLTAFESSFRRYDLLAERLPGYARCYPFIELGLAALLLSDYPDRSMSVSLGLNLIIIGLSALSIAGVRRSLRRKQDLLCACLGTLFKFPLSKVAIAESSVMLGMSILMVLLDSRTSMAMNHVAAVIGL